MAGRKASKSRRPITEVFGSSSSSSSPYSFSYSTSSTSSFFSSSSCTPSTTSSSPFPPPPLPPPPPSSLPPPLPPPPPPSPPPRAAYPERRGWRRRCWAASTWPWPRACRRCRRWWWWWSWCTLPRARPTGPQLTYVASRGHLTGDTKSSGCAVACDRFTYAQVLCHPAPPPPPWHPPPLLLFSRKTTAVGSVSRRRKGGGGKREMTHWHARTSHIFRSFRLCVCARVCLLVKWNRRKLSRFTFLPFYLLEVFLGGGLYFFPSGLYG